MLRATQPEQGSFGGRKRHKKDKRRRADPTFMSPHSCCSPGGDLCPGASLSTEATLGQLKLIVKLHLKWHRETILVLESIKGA